MRVQSQVRSGVKKQFVQGNLREIVLLGKLVLIGCSLQLVQDLG